MANYEILQNATLLVDLPSDMSDQGWVVSEGVAFHSGCNGGYIDRYFDLSSSTEWTFRYNVREWSSGAINIVVGENVGVSRTAVGTYEETFEVTGNNVLVRFYATGVNSVSLLQVYGTNLSVPGLTLAFNEDADKWVTYYSYVPEMMIKFLDGFYTFKDGELWEHNSNNVRNNFYGVQYTSKVSFYVNLSPTEVKTYFSMRQKSNKVWLAYNRGDIRIFPSEGKPAGQLSRLRLGRFKRLQTDWFADFLRDLSDPRFLTEDEALIKGAQLQGNVMRITLENNDTTEVRMLSVDVTVGAQNYTY